MHASHTHRGLGGLFAAVAVATALLSASALTQTPAAHAATGPTAARHAVSGIPRGVDTSKAALKAAAKGALSQRGRPGAHAAGAFPFSFGFNWGGAVLSVDRDLACSSVYGYQDLATLLVVSVFIPVPWNFVAMNAVSAYKGWMASQMGSQGVDISFNWWGSVTRIDPRGPRQPC